MHSQLPVLTLCDRPQALDVDKSGTVTLEELREGLAKQGSPITQREVEQLMESIDVDATGSIDYDEFLAATINMSQLQVGPLFFPSAGARISRS